MRDEQTAAIFDVDGTLLTGPSLERTFLSFLKREGWLGTRHLGAFFRGMMRGIPTRENKMHFRGEDKERLQQLARTCVDREIAPRLLRSALDRIRLHRISGHRVALISGTLDVLLQPLAELLCLEDAVGTDLEERNGVLTGRISGVHPYAKGKVKSLLSLQSRLEFDVLQSFAYGNHHTDRHLLAAVGHPVATNPDVRLERIALSRGWMIEDFVSADRWPLISRMWLKEGAH